MEFRDKINLIFECKKDGDENTFGEEFVINNKNNIELVINEIKNELLNK